MNSESFITRAERIIETYDCNGRNIPDTYTVLRRLHFIPRDIHRYTEIHWAYQQIVYSMWKHRDRNFRE